MPQVAMPVSDKQLSYIIALRAQRVNAEQYAAIIPTTSKEASDLIQKLTLLERLPNNNPVVTQDGMYMNPNTGEIYKVQRNKAQGDGSRLYAKLLTVESNDEKYKIKFIYTPGLMTTIKPEYKMTLQQAEEFGSLYGICVRCGRDLTNEDSIARAMGPICAGYF